MTLTPEQISKLYPIGAIALYDDCQVASVLRYSPPPEKKSPPKVTERGKITHLSQKSLNRLSFLAQTTTIQFKSMLTLTYLCPPVSGKQAKRDLGMALAWIKRRKKRCEYIWFAEFTKAYSIHFHLLLDCVPSYDDRICFALYWLRKTDQGRGRYCHLKKRINMRVSTSIFSSTSHPNAWNKLRKEDGAKRYISMYAGKPHQKQVPEWFQDIGRFWGCSKKVKKHREEPRIIELTEDELREILMQHHHKVGEWDVVPRHLWGVDGEWFKGLI